MSLYGPLSHMADERRRRRAEELNRQFEATILQIDEARKASEECRKTKKEMYKAKPAQKDLKTANDAMMGTALPLGASRKERKAAKGRKSR